MCIALLLIFLANAQDHLGFDHFYRAWVLGTVITWGLCVGGLALLMVQYCSGGKWGLLLRRPLEAMSRTLPLIIIYFLGLAAGMKRLYLWAQYTNVDDTAAALKNGAINEIQAHCLDFKRPMLNPATFLSQRRWEDAPAPLVAKATGPPGSRPWTLEDGRQAALDREFREKRWAQERAEEQALRARRP